MRRHYRAWHSSEAHRLSHQGIPRGLKLDGEYTEITILDRLPEQVNTLKAESVTADASPFLAYCLAKSHACIFLSVSVEGIILSCNDALTDLLMQSPSEVLGKSVWTLLPDEDAGALRQRLTDCPRDFDVHFLLNFVNSRHFPVTLTCRMDIQPGYFVIFGEAPQQKSRQAQEELLHLNNQLTVLSRENAQRNKELEKAKCDLTRAMEDLRTSHWHLRKIQEVLPICMDCGKVETGVEWQDVVTYLKKNALFLSHGYCPDCLANKMAKWNLPNGAK